jgi:release factor glutamine methyltransferase
MKTIEKLLRWGAEALPETPGIPDPGREARWLLARAMEVEEAALRLHPEREVPDETAAVFEEWIERRAAGEPAHHLTGRCTFWGRDFAVSPEVLVPRPETELVVEVALELPVSTNARVLDVGTGSGCLAVSLAAERPSWEVVAVDRSPAAVAVAARNARRHGVGVELLCGDLAESVSAGFDLVVANLPYVPSRSMADLPTEVRCDPAVALDGGEDGLDVVRRLLADLPRLLKPCGGAVLELGEKQADEVARSAAVIGLAVARRIRDLGGCDRVVVLQRR